MIRRDWWHLPALIGLAAVLLVLLWFVEADNKADKRKREQIEEQAAELETARDGLIKERDQLLRDFEANAAVPGTEQILILELDEMLFSEIYPVMQDEGIPAVLGLSGEAFPGDPGMISRSEFEDLMRAGWGLCLVCEDGSRFAQWDDEISARLEEEGIDKPVTVYFPEGQFSLSLEEEILRRGYTVAVHHGEDRLELTAGDAAEGLWLVGAHPWNYTGIRGQIDEVARKGGEHCFTLRFSYGREEYVRHSFDNMLGYIRSYRDKDTLRVTTFEEARRLHDPSLNGVNAAAELWRQRDAELAEQIRELERQIQEVYASWNDD